MARTNRPEASVDDLNQMQRYLGEEMIEDYHHGELTRRQMLRRLLAICGSASAAAALMIACGETSSGGAAPTTGAAPPTTVPPTAAPAAAAPTAGATTAPTTAATTAPTAGATAAATAQGAATTAATGAAQPAGSVSPISVPADDPEITGSDITFQSASQISGYLARPKADGTYPGVIVIHENRGLTDHIRDVARRLAKAGYVALAPDLASRAGGTNAVGPDKITGYFANVKPEDLVTDLNAAVDFLSQQGGVTPDKYGVVGFCFGGAYTLRLAAANPKILAAVPYYGVTPDPASIMSATNAAILGQYGATDQRVDATIPALEQVMQASGKTFEKRIYDGAGHAFNNDTGQSYNEAAALAAWKDTLGWFDKYLKG